MKKCKMIFFVEEIESVKVITATSGCGRSIIHQETGDLQWILPQRIIIYV